MQREHAEGLAAGSFRDHGLRFRHRHHAVYLVSADYQHGPDPMLLLRLSSLEGSLQKARLHMRT
jgi:hypothetical protein